MHVSVRRIGFFSLTKRSETNFLKKFGNRSETMFIGLDRRILRTRIIRFLTYFTEEYIGKNNLLMMDKWLIVYKLFGKNYGIYRRIHREWLLAQVYYEEYIGNRCILRSKLGQAVINDGLFGNYRLLVLVSFHSS